MRIGEDIQLKRQIVTDFPDKRKHNCQADKNKDQKKQKATQIRNKQLNSAQILNFLSPYFSFNNAYLKPDQFFWYYFLLPAQVALTGSPFAALAKSRGPKFSDFTFSKN